MALFNDFVRGIYEGSLMEDVSFELLERNAQGHINSVRYKGPWLIVDNGYLNWSTTVPPLKVTADEKEIRWSQWLESLRKDVECTFGILKVHWRILKTGIRLHGVEVADDIWMTCCALHNMLLAIDGLDTEWNGTIGMHDSDDVINNLPPFALQCLQNQNISPRSYDASGIGAGEDLEELIEAQTTSVPDDDVYDTNIAADRVVKKCSMKYFRKKLIMHFDILWSSID